jgi:tRNA G10  N-methylase Trm11
MSDLARRVASGENLDSILSDLYYGIEAEAVEFFDRLYENVLDVLEVAMSQTNMIGNNISPEPTIFLPPR